MAYWANVQARKGVVNSTYIIYVFLGDPSDDPGSWASDPNLVGTQAVINKLIPTSSEQGAIVTGVVPLTSALAKKALSHGLIGLDNDSVVDYLKGNLHWKAAMVSPRAALLHVAPFHAMATPCFPDAMRKRETRCTATFPSESIGSASEADMCTGWQR